MGDVIVCQCTPTRMLYNQECEIEMEQLVYQLL